LCLGNPYENTFSKLQIFVFLYEKENSEYVRVLAVCHTRKHFFVFSDICLQHFVEKSGILIPDLYFHNIKNTNHKLNTRENQ